MIPYLQIIETRERVMTKDYWIMFYEGFNSDHKRITLEEGGRYDTPEALDAVYDKFRAEVCRNHCEPSHSWFNPLETGIIHRAKVEHHA